jgi:hypothetical protein
MRAVMVVVVAPCRDQVAGMVVHCGAIGPSPMDDGWRTGAR